MTEESGATGRRRSSKTTTDEEEQPKKRCFVIAPIGREATDIRKRSDQILRHVIEPVVRELGYQEAIRADRIADPGLISQQVIQHIVEDELVIADLTGSNPNVFYELALRHALRKPFVQLLASDESLPFDVADQRTIPIDYRDLDSVEAAKSEMRRQIQALEKSNEPIDSPLSFSIDMQALRKSGDPLEQSNAEILDMLQRVLSLNNRTLAAVRSAPETSFDIEAFREFVEGMVKSGSISNPDDLQPLITQYTSGLHDAWVERTKGLIPRISPAPAVGGQFNDEPPF